MSNFNFFHFFEKKLRIIIRGDLNCAERGETGRKILKRIANPPDLMYNLNSNMIDTLFREWGLSPEITALLCCAGLVGYLIYRLHCVNQLLRHGISTQGRIARVGTSSHYLCTYRDKTGKKHERGITIPRDMTNGESVEILYSPNNPAEFITPGVRNPRAPIIYPLVTISLAGLFILFTELFS